MKKIKLGIIFYILLNIFSFGSVFAAVQQVEQSQENVSIIASFFSTQLLLNIIFSIVVLIGTIVLSKLITSKLTSYVERTTDGEAQGREELIGVINRTVNISLLSLGFLIILSILGIDTSILMGGIGFGLGFALKTFLTNFLAGILMVTQGHYHNGDLVRVGEKIGHIKAINSLFTSIKQFDGIVFYVPNVKFMEEVVSNYNANDKRRVEIDVGVDYSTDLVKSKEVISRVLDNFPNILKAPEHKIWITDFGESSINIGIRFWINTDDHYFDIKSNVTETINLAFRKNGITIPFPQVTLSNREDFKIDIEK